MAKNDNAKKRQRGINAKAALEYAVIKLDELDLLTATQQTPKFTDGDYPKDKNRFSANYLVQLADGKEAILFSTNSIRDRIKEQQWEALNVKRLQPAIEYAWLITPDDSSHGGPNAIVAKINDHRTCSSLDKVITIEEFCDTVLEAYEPTVSSGVFGDKSGKVFEARFEAVMGYKGNLELFNDEVESGVGYQYDLFKQAMDFMRILPRSVASIKATRDIPRLQVGEAKTDVLLTLAYRDGHTEVKTFSCKNSHATSVQVNQFRAETCANILDPNNKQLLRALRDFQKVGNRTAMKKTNIATLKSEMQKHLIDFLMWCIGGHGTPGATKEQCAEYLVARNSSTKKVAFHRTDELCKSIAFSADSKHGFGTGLSWTYQGKRGGSIQVKAALSKLVN